MQNAGSSAQGKTGTSKEGVCYMLVYGDRRGTGHVEESGSENRKHSELENGVSDNVKCRVRRLEDIERVRAVRGRVPALLAVLADDLRHVVLGRHHARPARHPRRGRCILLEQVAREDVVPGALANLAHLLPAGLADGRRQGRGDGRGALRRLLGQAPGRLLLAPRELVLEPVDFALELVLAVDLGGKSLSLDASPPRQISSTTNLGLDERLELANLLVELCAISVSVVCGFE